ncbi:uncharacterized protein LOC114252798 [Bombyx mandarina]|uniref:Uncharacterized protein LOC114252798 n=1 Tax=Bombyx mandarina TaxID=7092 RepID=A0A6J2KNY8_BOMMA|nr:uncharacterized protein LOC114252798 [Bombyx mandarina]
MEDIMNALRHIQKELDEQKIAIQRSGEKVTEQVTQNINSIMEEKFTILEKKYDNLQTKVENQEKRLYFLEKQARRRNFVLFGLDEKETSYSNLENTLVEFTKKYFELNIERRDIQEIKRIGKKGERPRPIVVTLSNLGLKIEICKQKNALKDTTYYIKEDYPRDILNKRKELQKQLKIEREKGNTAIIKYDKLIVLDKDKNITNKRNLSISPENIHNLVNKPKKNKQQLSDSKIKVIRSNSVTEKAIKPSMLNFLTTNKNT